MRLGFATGFPSPSGTFQGFFVARTNHFVCTFTFFSSQTLGQDSFKIGRQ